MANPKKRVPENTPGDFFVDSTCINCDACRQIAPAVFGEAAESSQDSEEGVKRGSDQDTQFERRRLDGG